MCVAKSTLLFASYLIIGVWLMPFLGSSFHQRCRHGASQLGNSRMQHSLWVGVGSGIAYLLFHSLIEYLPYRLLAFGGFGIGITLLLYMLSDESTFIFAVCPVFFMTGLMEFFSDPGGRPFAVDYLAPVLRMLALFISTLIVGFVLVWGRYIHRQFPDIEDFDRGVAERRIHFNRWVKVGVNYCLIINAYFWMGVVLVFISGISLELQGVTMILRYVG